MTNNQTTRQRLEQILETLNEREERESVYVKIYNESARHEADAADQRAQAGLSLGPLDGKIISVKDLFDVAGEETLAGSVIRKSAIPASRDAVIIERLRAAGAVIIGKTQMTEFAFTAVGLNPHYPVPGNIINADLIPGGSSSGAAISVGEGSCDIAIGSDTGGSVRIPASLNGLTGFKPSHGRIALAGAFPLSPSLDSIGPIAKNVADCAFADAIMAGAEPEALPVVNLQGLRIGVGQGILVADLDQETTAAWQTVLKRFDRAGFQLEPCNIDDLILELHVETRIGSIAGIEAARIHQDWLDDHDAPVDIRVSSTLRRRISVSDLDYAALMTARGRLIEAIDERLSAYDLVIMPTTPITATPIADVVANEKEYRRVEDLLLRNTQIANQFDLAGLSLPIPNCPKPVGLMLMGRKGTDRHILAIGAAVEALFNDAGDSKIG